MYSYVTLPYITAISFVGSKAILSLPFQLKRFANSFVNKYFKIRLVSCSIPEPPTAASLRTYKWSDNQIILTAVNEYSVQ